MVEDRWLSVAGTLMHDPVYRLGVAWQNVAYNQPPHTSFFLGHGMNNADACDLSSQAWRMKRLRIESQY